MVSGVDCRLPSGPDSCPTTLLAHRLPESNGDSKPCSWFDWQYRETDLMHPSSSTGRKYHCKQGLHQTILERRNETGPPTCGLVWWHLQVDSSFAPSVAQRRRSPLNSLSHSGGQVVGQFSIQWVSDWLGRKGAMYTMMVGLTLVSGLSPKLDTQPFSEPLS